MVDSPHAEDIRRLLCGLGYFYDRERSRHVQCDFFVHPNVIEHPLPNPAVRGGGLKTRAGDSGGGKKTFSAACYTWRGVGTWSRARPGQGAGAHPRCKTPGRRANLREGERFSGELRQPLRGEKGGRTDVDRRVHGTRINGRASALPRRRSRPSRICAPLASGRRRLLRFAVFCRPRLKKYSMRQQHHDDFQKARPIR
jgi:hypothetical protein